MLGLGLNFFCLGQVVWPGGFQDQFGQVTCVVLDGRIASWFCWLATVPWKNGCIRSVVIFHVPWQHHVYIIIMLKHMLSFCVEPEGETILVEQVLEESSVVTGFDNRVLIRNLRSSMKASPGLSIKPLPCLLWKVYHLCYLLH